MNFSKVAFSLFGVAALGLAGYAVMRVRGFESRQTLAVAAPAAAPVGTEEPDLLVQELDAQRMRTTQLEIQVQQLQEQVQSIGSAVDDLRRAMDEANRTLSNITRNATGGVANGAATAVPDPPADEVVATTRITDIGDAELAQRVQAAYQRTPEALTPVTAADIQNMPINYEWGSGPARRIWRLMDTGAYWEVYPDGRYSVLPILGRAVVNGQSGVIATKDDGMLDVFIPDLGGRMVHQIRSSRSQSNWVDYSPMGEVD